MPEYTPRTYQTEAINALVSGFQGPHNRLGVVLPTGAGKTVVFSHAITRMLPELNGRILVIAHREELIQQAAEKIREVAPDLKVGIVKAERDEHAHADVIVASIQTLAVQRRREAITGIGMIIVDECHHAAATTYMTVLEHFGAWRGLPVAGFTATMTRQDGGLADVWQEVVYTRDILDMIGDGYLCDVRGKRVIVEGLDLDAVKVRGGDLQDGQLGQAMDESGAADVVADAYQEFASDRPGVVFTPTVDTAMAMADALAGTGITAEPVWGAMPEDKRADVLQRYRSGDVQVLTNCMVLTEGFDAPWTSCAVIARPTKAPGLYCQMVGRALRLWEGKKDALILDVMGASTRHKLASLVDLTGRAIPAPKDGQTLAESAEEEQARDLIAEVEWEEVNLFGQSKVRWLRTPSKTWFLDLKDDMFLFLLRAAAPGMYKVRLWTPGRGAQVPDPDAEMPLSEAMWWSERYARRNGARFLDRSAPWRAGPPSAKQLGLCRRFGVQALPGSTAGDVSDLLTEYRVASVLDPFMAVAA